MSLSSAIWICGLPYPFFRTDTFDWTSDLCLHSANFWNLKQTVVHLYLFSLFQKNNLLLSWHRGETWIRNQKKKRKPMFWGHSRPKLWSFRLVMTNKPELRGERTLNWSRLYRALKRRLRCKKVYNPLWFKVRYLILCSQQDLQMQIVTIKTGLWLSSP